MQYIVSLSQPYAIPNDEHALDYILTATGYDSLDEFIEEVGDPSYSTITAPELAEELHGATLEDELDTLTYLDQDGYVMSYEDIEDMARDSLNDAYGVIEVAGLTFDASYVLEELDPIAFRSAVSDFMDGEYFDSWTEWHNAVA